MKDSPSLIEARVATIERVNEAVLHVRFKPEVRLDTSGLNEVLEERQRLCPEGPHDVLAVFPPELDFDMQVMTKDHYLGRGLEHCTASLAVAAGSPMNERLVSLYFAYFPQPFETRVFTDEREASLWLEDRTAARNER